MYTIRVSAPASFARSVTYKELDQETVKKAVCRRIHILAQGMRNKPNSSNTISN